MTPSRILRRSHTAFQDSERRRRRRFRPGGLTIAALERLEDRTLMTLVIHLDRCRQLELERRRQLVVGRVPGGSDTAEFGSVSGASTTVIVDPKAEGAGELEIDSSWNGTIDVQNPIAFETMTIAAGTLKIESQMTIGGSQISPSQWTGGAIEIEKGGQINNSGYLVFESDLVNPALLGVGTFLNYGTIDDQIASGGNLMLDGTTLRTTPRSTTSGLASSTSWQIRASAMIPTRTSAPSSTRATQRLRRRPHPAPRPSTPTSTTTGRDRRPDRNDPTSKRRRNQYRRHIHRGPGCHSRPDRRHDCRL